MMNNPPARGLARFFPHLLPCAGLALFCTLLFWWKPFGAPPRQAYFHALIRAELPGTALCSYDVDGAGYRAGHTTPAPYPGGAQAHEVWFLLPAGKLGGLIFGPRADAGETDVLRCWLTGESGAIIAEIPLPALAETNRAQAEPMPGGNLRFRSAPASALNGLTLHLNVPLSLPSLSIRRSGRTCSSFLPRSVRRSSSRVRSGAILRAFLA